MRPPDAPPEPVEAAGPVDAQHAPTRSLENRRRFSTAPTGQHSRSQRRTTERRPGSQRSTHRFCGGALNCLFSGGLSSQVGVATDRAGGKGGSFSWIGGGGGGNQAADFSIGDPNNGVVSITNAVFGRSARFVKTGGPSGASFLFRVDGVRWSGDALAADGIAIDFRFSGPISIRNSRIGELSTKALTISWNPGGQVDSANFVFEGNAVRHAAGAPLFVGRQPSRLTDNIIY